MALSSPTADASAGIRSGGGLGKGGVGTLSVDGRAVDSHRIPRTICCTQVWFEGLDVGADNSTPVDDQYTVPNKFTGDIDQVVFNTGEMKLTPNRSASTLSAFTPLRWVFSEEREFQIHVLRFA